MAFPLTAEEHDRIEDFITSIPEIIVAAAMKKPDSDAIVMFPRPHRHSSSIQLLLAMGEKCGGEEDVWNCGFVTSHGRFVDRKEAGEIVTKTGQGTYQTHAGNPNKNLYSEDLWIDDIDRKAMR